MGSGDVYYGILLSSEEVSKIESFFKENFAECSKWWEHVEDCSNGDAYWYPTTFYNFYYYMTTMSEDFIFESEKWDRSEDVNSFVTPGFPTYYGIRLGQAYVLVQEAYKNKLEITEGHKRQWKTVYNILKRFGFKNKRPKIHVHW